MRSPVRLFRPPPACYGTDPLFIPERNEESAMKSFLLALLTGLITTSVLTAAEKNDAAQNDPPNVIIIYADDLGLGDLACYGSDRFQTPYIDRMAREGVRLTDFSSSCPYCAPSRASLLTGRYPFRNNMMLGNPVPEADYGLQQARKPNPELDQLGLPDDELTLGELFQQQGYATMAIGKWHLGHQPQFHPTKHGFNDYLGILYSNDMHPVQLFRNDDIVEYPVVQATLTKRYTEAAVAFIEKNKDQPFFLYLPHAMPHKPLACSEDFYSRQPSGPSPDLYRDVIAELDWSVGHLLERLQQLKLDESTLVVFTSDNGPWFGGSTGGLRGMKSRTWEGGLRVPAIMRWPGTIPADQTITEPTIIMDVFSTVLAAAKIPAPKDRVIDGVNLLPVMQGEANISDRLLFSFQGDVKSVRHGEWKYHQQMPPALNFPDDWIDPRRPNGVTLLAPIEQYGPSAHPGIITGDQGRGPGLFNLKDDPTEQNNVAEENKDIFNQLAKYREAMQQQTGLPPGKGKLITP